MRRTTTTTTRRRRRRFTSVSSNARIFYNVAKHSYIILMSARALIPRIVLALVLQSTLLCQVSTNQQPLRSRGDTTDLAFVAPAGGSSLRVGQEFELAMQVVSRPTFTSFSSDRHSQLTAAIPTVSFIWTDSPSSSSRSVLYNALLHPNQTTVVRSGAPALVLGLRLRQRQQCRCAGRVFVSWMRCCSPRRWSVA